MKTILKHLKSGLSKRAGIITVSAFMSILFLGGTAMAQGMETEPWQANGGAPRNGVGIASLIYNIENGGATSAASTTTAGQVGGNVTQLVCGTAGEGTSSNAQANSSCIIMNNSNGAIDVGQDSEGDQTADTETNVDTDIDEILTTLEGE